MNNDLIKRIDDLVNRGYSELENTATWVFTELLADCRAEIELLSQSNECLRNQNTALDEILAEYSERKYVPMTDDEWREYFDDDMSGLSYNFYREIEAHIIKRAGLEIKHD